MNTHIKYSNINILEMKHNFSAYFHSERVSDMEQKHQDISEP